MRASALVAVLVAVVALPTWAGVGSVPIQPGGIEIKGTLSVRGTLRLTLLLMPTAAAQPAIHAVRITALPSGRSLFTLVTAGAPTAATDAAVDTEGAALKAPVTGEALTVQAEPAPPGDNRVRVEYITQLDTGELVTRIVGEAQFVSLEEFHFSLEPDLFPSMMPALGCGYCGDALCGCARCPDLNVCCPVCSVACPPYGC